MRIVNLKAFKNETGLGTTNSKTLKEFENLVRGVVDTESVFSGEWSSKGTTIFEVSCGNKYKFSISRILFNIAELEKVKREIKRFTYDVLSQDEENNGKIYHCFMDELLGFDSLAELHYRLLVLYLEPVNWKFANVLFDYFDRSFRIAINGGEARFHLQDLKSGLWDMELVSAFKEFVDATEKISIISFDSKERKIKKHLPFL